MSTKKARHCQECRHHYFKGPTGGLSCMRNHRPRFYTPDIRRSDFADDKAWGWKRVCDDFEKMKDGSEI